MILQGSPQQSTTMLDSHRINWAITYMRFTDFLNMTWSTAHFPRSIGIHICHLYRFALSAWSPCYAGRLTGWTPSSCDVSHWDGIPESRTIGRAGMFAFIPSRLLSLKDKQRSFGVKPFRIFQTWIMMYLSRLRWSENKHWCLRRL